MPYGMTHPLDGPRLKVRRAVQQIQTLADLQDAYRQESQHKIVRAELNPKTGKYTPDANAPAYLIYRDADAHQQKPTGRRPGAERTLTVKGSDIGIKTKFARLERKARATIKPKGFGGTRKIASRPFPKGRKFRNGYH